MSMIDKYGDLFSLSVNTNFPKLRVRKCQRPCITAIELEALIMFFHVYGNEMIYLDSSH